MWGVKLAHCTVQSGVGKPDTSPYKNIIFTLEKSGLLGDTPSFLLMAVFSVHLVLPQVSYVRDGRYVWTCWYTHAGKRGEAGRAVEILDKWRRCSVLPQSRPVPQLCWRVRGFNNYISTWDSVLPMEMSCELEQFPPVTLENKEVLEPKQGSLENMEMPVPKYF